MVRGMRGKTRQAFRFNSAEGAGGGAGGGRLSLGPPPSGARWRRPWPFHFPAPWLSTAGLLQRPLRESPPGESGGTALGPVLGAAEVTTCAGIPVPGRSPVCSASSPVSCCVPRRAAGDSSGMYPGCCRHLGKEPANDRSLCISGVGRYKVKEMAFQTPSQRQEETGSQ